jgi:aminopeptidase N
LAATKDAKWGATYKSVLEKEPAYPVISAAMQALYKVDADAATQAAKRYENDENGDLVSGVGSIYAENPKAEHVAFFERNLMKVDGLPSVGFLGSYVKVLEKLGETNVVDKMGKLKDIAVNQTQSPYRRFACTKAINDIRQKYKTQASGTYVDLSKFLTEISMKETNEQLKQIYGQMLGM